MSNSAERDQKTADEIAFGPHEFRIVFAKAIFSALQAARKEEREVCALIAHNTLGWSTAGDRRADAIEKQIRAAGEER